MRRPKCLFRPKVCHPDIDRARRHARGVEEHDRRRGREPRPGWVLKPYWCDIHKCFHVGHRRVTEQATQPIIEETIT